MSYNTESSKYNINSKYNSISSSDIYEEISISSHSDISIELSLLKSVGPLTPINIETQISVLTYNLFDPLPRAFLPEPGSPRTDLVEDLDTELKVLDSSVLPDPPNILTIYDRNNNFETIIYNKIEGNLIKELTREINGSKLEWGAHCYVSRNFTSYDHLFLLDSLKDIRKILYKEGIIELDVK